MPFNSANHPGKPVDIPPEATHFVLETCIKKPPRLRMLEAEAWRLCCPNFSRPVVAMRF